MKNWPEAFQRVSRELDALQQRVNAATSLAPVQTKTIPAVYSYGFAFARGDFTPQERTLINGAEDVGLVSLTATVTCHEDGGGPPVPIPGDKLFPLDVGYSNLPNLPAPAIADRIPRPLFDFEWNYLLLSTQALYCPRSNGGQYISRKSLGNSERAEVLEFEVPLKVVAGDALNLMVRPTMYDIGGWSFPAHTPLSMPNYRVVVQVTARGFRTGTMAEVPL